MSQGLKNFFLSALLLANLFFPSGCVYFIVGGVGAVGGYIVSPDTVEGIAQHDAASVLSSAVEIVSVMGVIEEKNDEGGFIIAKINGSRVTIIVTALNDSMAKLSIKARRAFFPKISVAQDIFVKIMNGLQS